METLLIIDDNEEIRTQLKWGLGKDYSVHLAEDAGKGIALFNRLKPKAVILDLGLPPNEDSTEEGFRCLEMILRERPHTKVVVVTGEEGRESALKAVKMGAYDYYRKPVELEELKVIIKRAFHLYNIEEENRKLQGALDKSSEMGGMIGQCPEMLEVFATIRKVSSSDASVLVAGESGTGKELVARAIHSNSLRRDSTFVPINCSAIPENLLESELFGYEKGAFTGAHTQVQGKVEFANKGTLFLDEIGELPASLQVKLLRFLQEKTIQRIGGREDIPVDARIVAATNTDIAKAMGDGSFREDLYYRIGVITIKLTPLRERKEDIMLLSNYFLQQFSGQYGKKVKGFSPSAIEWIESYGWPGNVRELENRLQRAVIMSESPVVDAESLGFIPGGARRKVASSPNMTLKEARESVERDMLVAAMEKHEGNIAKAAESLGISRPTLYDLMKKHGILAKIQNRS